MHIKYSWFKFSGFSKNSRCILEIFGTFQKLWLHFRNSWHILKILYAFWNFLSASVILSAFYNFYIQFREVLLDVSVKLNFFKIKFVPIVFHSYHRPFDFSDSNAFLPGKFWLIYVPCGLFTLPYCGMKLSSNFLENQVPTNSNPYKSKLIKSIVLISPYCTNPL